MGDEAWFMAARTGNLSHIRQHFRRFRRRQDRAGCTALMHAAWNEHVDVARFLSKYEATLRNSAGYTALMLAVRREDGISYISGPDADSIRTSRIDKCCDIHARLQKQGEIIQILAPLESSITLDDGRTALLIAAEQGNSEAVTALLHNRQELRLPRDWSPLMYACLLGDFNTFRNELDRCRGMRTKRKQTALMFAATMGYESMVKALIPHEAGRQDYKLRTALIFAARNGHETVVVRLMHREKRLGDSAGRTALMYSVLIRNAEIAAALASYEATMQDTHGMTALCYAGMTGCVRCVELLKDSEQDIVDNDRMTPLMYAAIYNHSDAARLLACQRGRVDKDGLTALMYSGMFDNVPVAEELLETEKGITDSHGKTALHYAVQTRSRNMVRLLAPYESNAADSHSHTPLYYALRDNQVDLAKNIVEYNTVLDIPSTWTRLMLAVVRNDPTEANRLLGEEACKKTDDGYTALILAARYGCLTTAKLLLGREGRLCDNRGWTALMHAAAAPDRSLCVELLMQREMHMTTSTGITATMLAARYGRAENLRILLSNVTGWRRETSILDPVSESASCSTRPCLPLSTSPTSTTPGTIRYAKTAGAKTLGEGADGSASRSTPSHIASSSWSPGTGLSNVVDDTTTLDLSGSELRMVDSHGRTALMHAAKYGHEEAALLLIPYEKGRYTPDGESALSLAERYGHKGLVEILSRYEKLRELTSESGLTDRPTPPVYTDPTPSAHSNQPSQYVRLDGCVDHEAPLPDVLEDGLFLDQDFHGYSQSGCAPAFPSGDPQTCFTFEESISPYQGQSPCSPSYPNTYQYQTPFAPPPLPTGMELSNLGQAALIALTQYPLIQKLCRDVEELKNATIDPTTQAVRRRRFSVCQQMSRSPSVITWNGMHGPSRHPTDSFDGMHEPSTSDSVNYTHSISTALYTQPPVYSSLGVTPPSFSTPTTSLFGGDYRSTSGCDLLPNNTCVEPCLHMFYSAPGSLDSGSYCPKCGTAITRVMYATNQ
ncbi:Ankyrin repeat protein 1 [Giardia muris]|uniref:Ankyrin repeat protein 1 n=1 Tax=Giardia muris TaxID=5742 RepID=A0A4Z1SQU5_GIAMU|nr:Ankyrin repeat protein 1 [Giardia muris]|eukprot:TNJ28244.1 Ankyrin repeat protein 1 [Giardia muris]